ATGLRLARLERSRQPGNATSGGGERCRARLGGLRDPRGRGSAHAAGVERRSLVAAHGRADEDADHGARRDREQHPDESEEGASASTPNITQSGCRLRVAARPRSSDGEAFPRPRSRALPPNERISPAASSPAQSCGTLGSAGCLTPVSPTLGCGTVGAARLGSTSSPAWSWSAFVSAHSRPVGCQEPAAQRYCLPSWQLTLPGEKNWFAYMHWLP